MRSVPFSKNTFWDSTSTPDAIHVVATGCRTPVRGEKRASCIYLLESPSSLAIRRTESKIEHARDLLSSLHDISPTFNISAANSHSGHFYPMLSNPEYPRPQPLTPRLLPQAHKWRPYSCSVYAAGSARERPFWVRSM